MIETALRLRAMLKDEGLEPWPKLTGRKGLHLLAPLDRTMDHDPARSYAKQIAQRLAASMRGRYTLASAPGRCPGRIFIDYLRTDRGTTAIGARSPRARTGFPVAAPVSWRPLEEGVSSAPSRSGSRRADSPIGWPLMGVVLAGGPRPTSRTDNLDVSGPISGGNRCFPWSADRAIIPQ